MLGNKARNPTSNWFSAKVIVVILYHTALRKSPTYAGNKSL